MTFPMNGIQIEYVLLKVIRSFKVISFRTYPTADPSIAFILPLTAKRREHSWLRINWIAFFLEGFQVNRSRWNCFLGTDILCVLLFLSRNKNSQDFPKRMRLQNAYRELSTQIRSKWPSRTNVRNVISERVSPQISGRLGTSLHMCDHSSQHQSVSRRIFNTKRGNIFC